MTKIVLDAATIKSANDAYAVTRQAEINAFDAVLRQTIGQAPEVRAVSDATAGMSFLVSQLAYTEAGVYSRQYTPMQYERLVPISSEAGEWAETVRYQTYDSVARGRRASSKSDDINLVDITVAERSMDIAPGDIGYHFTQQELIQSAYLKRPLPQGRMEAAMDGYRRHMNDVALNGEGSDLKGLFQHPSISKGNVPSGKTWATATPAQILGDLNAGLYQVFNSSANNDVPNTIVLPPAAYALINSTPRSDNSDMTILEYFKANNLYKDYIGGEITVLPGFGLQTAGTSKGTRALFYTNSAERLVMHIPVTLRFLAPQLRGRGVFVPGDYRYSGVEVRYSKSAYYMEGM